MRAIALAAAAGGHRPKTFAIVFFCLLALFGFFFLSLGGSVSALSGARSARGGAGRATSEKVVRKGPLFCSALLCCFQQSAFDVFAAFVGPSTAARIQARYLRVDEVGGVDF
jgi:hypothetical protein